MTAKDYLDYIVNEIHRTIVATVDDDALPVTAAMWQDAFAEKLHVSLSTVSNWETQRVRPTRENYVLLKQTASEKGINIYDA